ncbi:zinc finger BED domain-containing protein 1 [Drosophila innubila]|uniref:zinc finger BED domain-containing protein 1 n=1 Tax=Drosophila innubila TaxID=198719 RepID=UPI00148E8610|nr:zinc finger BED domain-containing protein 1 [Drosophila innubila]
MARSKIWKYYDKIDLQTAQCLLCEKIIKTCGNTSNLMKHMKTHPTIDVNDHQSIVVRGMLKRETNPSRTRGRKILKYASIKVKSEANVVAVSDMDVNLIEFVDPEAHVAVESVGNCEETYAHWATADTESAAETVSAADIIEFEPKVAQDHSDHMHMLDDALPDNKEVNNCQTLQDNLAYFVCRDKHPLDVIKGEGFKRLTQVLCPSFQLPSIDQLGVRIAQKVQVHTAKMRQQFGNLQTLSLSCAINTTSVSGSLEQVSYLEVAAHYNEGVHRRSRTLSVQTLPPQYNASSIVERLERICQRFDINKSKIVCIVTSSSRLLENAVATLLGSQRHVPCFANLLETLLESVVERQSFFCLCDKVRSRVAYQLSCSSSLYTQLQLDVNGRAISSYEMLEGYVRQAPHLNKLQQSALEAPPALNSSELELALELLGVLRPVASAIRQLCGSNGKFFPCASSALPIAYTILNELKQAENVNQQQHQISHEMRLFVIKQLEERFEGMEKNILLALSSLLDPRFRNMPFQSASLVAKYMTHLYNLFEEKAETTEAESEDEATSDCYDIWAAYRAFSHEKHKHITMSGESENQDEISSYFCTNISSLQTEPLLLWKDLSQFHPFLHSLSKKYLHIPASAIPPARIFTAAGAEVLAQHSKMLSDHMSNILFMSDCTQEEWQL